MSEIQKDWLLYLPVLVWIFLQHQSPYHFSKKKKWLDFRDDLRKILFLSCKKANTLGRLIVYSSVAFFRQRVMKPKVKYTASSVVSDCFHKLHYLSAGDSRVIHF